MTGSRPANGSAGPSPRSVTVATMRSGAVHSRDRTGERPWISALVTEELLVGVVEDRLVEISAAVSRCTRPHISLLPAGAAVLTLSGLPCAAVVIVPSPSGRPGPRRGACRDRLEHRSSRSPTIRHTAEPSATNRRNRPWGRTNSRTRAFSAAACSTAEVTTSLATGVASRWAVAEPQPHTSRTLCSTRRVAQGACGVGGRSMLHRNGAHLVIGDQKASPAAGREPRSAPTAAQHVPHPAP